MITDQLSEKFHLPLRSAYNNTRGFYLQLYTGEVSGRKGKGRQHQKASASGMTAEQLPSEFIKVTRQRNTLSFTTIDLLRLNCEWKWQTPVIRAYARIHYSCIKFSLRKESFVNVTNLLEFTFPFSSLLSQLQLEPTTLSVISIVWLTCEGYSHSRFSVYSHGQALSTDALSMSPEELSICWQQLSSCQQTVHRDPSTVACSLSPWQQIDWCCCLSSVQCIEGTAWWDTPARWLSLSAERVCGRAGHAPLLCTLCHCVRLWWAISSIILRHS